MPDIFHACRWEASSTSASCTSWPPPQVPQQLLQASSRPCSAIASSGPGAPQVTKPKPFLLCFRSVLLLSLDDGAAAAASGYKRIVLLLRSISSTNLVQMLSCGVIIILSIYTWTCLTVIVSLENLSVTGDGKKVRCPLCPPFSHGHSLEYHQVLEVTVSPGQLYRLPVSIVSIKLIVRERPYGIDILLAPRGQINVQSSKQSPD